MTYEPDIISLNDWILFKHPEVFNATKYISNTTKLMKVWLKVWENAGKPNIEEINYIN